MLVSHHWERKGKMDWLLDRGIGSLVIMSQASTRDSLSSGGEVGSSRTGDGKGYREVLTSLNRDYRVEW